MTNCKIRIAFRCLLTSSTIPYCRYEYLRSDILTDGVKQLISKVGSGVYTQKRSVDSRFRELLTDFRGQ